MPEAQIILANAVTLVACAPKSNAAVCAIDAAMRCVQETGNLPVPRTCRMPIIKERRNWDTDLIINMLIIIRIIMSDSSICLMS